MVLSLLNLVTFCVFYVLIKEFKNGLNGGKFLRSNFINVKLFFDKFNHRKMSLLFYTKFSGTMSNINVSSSFQYKMYTIYSKQNWSNLSLSSVSICLASMMVVTSSVASISLILAFKAELFPTWGRIQISEWVGGIEAFVFFFRGKQFSIFSSKPKPHPSQQINKNVKNLRKM